MVAVLNDNTAYLWRASDTGAESTPIELAIPPEEVVVDVALSAKSIAFISRSQFWTRPINEDSPENQQKLTLWGGYEDLATVSFGAPPTTEADKGQLGVQLVDRAGRFYWGAIGGKPEVRMFAELVEEYENYMMLREKYSEADGESTKNEDTGFTGHDGQLEIGVTECQDRPMQACLNYTHRITSMQLWEQPLPFRLRGDPQAPKPALLNYECVRDQVGENAKNRCTVLVGDPSSGTVLAFHNKFDVN